MMINAVAVYNTGVYNYSKVKNKMLFGKNT